MLPYISTHKELLSEHQLMLPWLPSFAGLASSSLSSLLPIILLSIGRRFASGLLVVHYVSFPHTSHFFAKSVAKQGPPPPALCLSLSFPPHNHLFLIICILISAVSASEPQLAEISEQLRSVKKIQRFFKRRESCNVLSRACYCPKECLTSSLYNHGLPLKPRTGY